MYTFSNRLKTFSFILIILGVLGVAYGFISSNKSLEEVKTLIAQEASAHHGGGHAEAGPPHPAFQDRSAAEPPQ